MWIPDFILKMFGKSVANKLNLQEDSKMDGTKPWYQSKNVWTGVVTVLVAAYGTAAVAFKLPAIPEWIFTILGAIGIYTRVVATDKVG